MKIADYTSFLLPQVSSKMFKFEYYLREVLPDILTIEHTMLRNPHLIVFAYQGDHSLWGYAEIESWKSPSSKAQAEVGVEWGGSKFRRLYKIVPCSLREFKKHVPYAFLRDFGFETRSIIYGPQISVGIFNQVLKKADGEINLCARDDNEQKKKWQLVVETLKKVLAE